MCIQKNNILVRDVMIEIGRFPVINQKSLLKEALQRMSQFQIGIVCIIGQEAKLLGILTDGDVRRMLLKVQKPFSAFFVDDALEHAVTSPLKVLPDDTLLRAIRLMEDNRVWDLPVVDEDSKLLGLLHLHPAIDALLKI